MIDDVKRFCKTKDSNICINCREQGEMKMELLISCILVALWGIKCKLQIKLLQIFCLCECVGYYFQVALYLDVVYLERRLYRCGWRIFCTYGWSSHTMVCFSYTLVFLFFFLRKIQSPFGEILFPNQAQGMTDMDLEVLSQN